ncbi:MAG: ABC transporter permease [Prevotellaceae bacterium]|jgi:ABC-type antimicrobial peptide transport system permease subunit|nr:ABC transporter permease [Prevotellaceae bacterium]
MYNLKLVLRNIRHNILYSSINVVGLAISLAVAALILLWVQDETSYDRFHKNADNTYVTIVTYQVEGHVESSSITPGFTVRLLKEYFGEIESFCRIRQEYAGFIEHNGETFSGKLGVLADSTFFSFFSFPIIEGRQTNLLQSPTDVIISKRLSEQLFGEGNPIGKSIKLESVDMHVVAVMENIPHNSYFYRVDFVCPFSSNLSPYHLEALDETGYGAEYLSFIRVHPGSSVEDMSAKFTKEAKALEPSVVSVWFQPIGDMHSYSVDSSVSMILFIRMFLLIAIVILIIACINYVSLVTARASGRAREIGLRKIVGAQRYRLFIHLLLEAFVLFIFAIAIAVILIIVFLPLYNQLSGKQLIIDWLNPNIWLIFGGCLLTVTLIAGVYPAILLTTYKPTNFMKCGTSKGGSNNIFRKVLVVIQFVCAVVFIVGAITLHAQMRYVRQKALGYDKEHVFTFDSYNIAEHFDAVKAELTQHHSIRGVTAASENIMYVSSGHQVSDWEGKTILSPVAVVQERIDTGFLSVMRTPLIAGKGFTSSYKTEYIFNEAAIEAMGITNPIGKRVDVVGPGTIAGVVKDFHYTSLHDPIRPLVMYWHEQYSYNKIFVRTTASDATAAIAAVEKAWKRYNSDYTFGYSFLDDEFDYMYRTDQRIGKLFDVFTVIAMLISGLGLFGLVTYAAETKTKEIGIRKTLGASITDIITMISKEFLLLIAIAILIAFPLAYYLLDTLLQSYAYRISISWRILVLAAVVVSVLVILTVSGQVLKAARANPVKAIKTE